MGSALVLFSYNFLLKIKHKLITLKKHFFKITLKHTIFFKNSAGDPPQLALWSDGTLELQTLWKSHLATIRGPIEFVSWPVDHFSFFHFFH